MALPHSGGKNQGDIASNGRNKIKKNPVKYSEYNLSEDTLFFIYFYDINKTLKKQTIVVEKRKIVITSGYFNPIHIGHLNLLKAAKDFGDFLVVIVNNDNQVKAKKSAPFMSETERVAIIKDLKYVDEVFLSIDNSLSIAESLKTIAKQYSGELFFAKGGDRNSDNIPNEEKIICEKFKIKVINGVGGGKVQSSSWILNNIKKS
ncbi:MAG: adenylyltransferase/cytidyltransferase family protein [Candidatus Staskawiczbacteria bacterium]|nr:adenylyltransferase/cytidyltransferase family protein [Candidatus Staskawiczbacteria bacterium]